MSPVSLAVVVFLVVPVATAAQSTQRNQKQRKAGQAAHELEAEKPAAALEQPSSSWWARQRALREAGAEPEKASTIPPRTAVNPPPESITILVAEGANLVGIPLNVPRQPGPASPIR